MACGRHRGEATPRQTTSVATGTYVRRPRGGRTHRPPLTLALLRRGSPMALGGAADGPRRPHGEELVVAQQTNVLRAARPERLSLPGRSAEFHLERIGRM